MNHPPNSPRAVETVPKFARTFWVLLTYMVLWNSKHLILTGHLSSRNSHKFGLGWFLAQNIPWMDLGGRILHQLIGGKHPTLSRMGRRALFNELLSCLMRLTWRLLWRLLIWAKLAVKVYIIIYHYTIYHIILYHIVLYYNILYVHDIWYMICDMWYGMMICQNIWYMVYDTWYIIYDIWNMI